MAALEMFFKGFSHVTCMHEPHTLREVSSNPLWQKTMKEELDTLIKIGTWDLVDLTTENML